MDGVSAHDIEVDSAVWHWWLEHGLDGIAGGILGGVLAGLVAWWALRRTIAHERGLTEQADRKAEERELRASVVELVAVSTRIFISTPKQLGDDWMTVWTELYAAVWKLDAVAALDEPKLSAELTSFRKLMIALGKDESEDFDKLQSMASDLTVWLTAWLGSTRKISALMRPKWEETADAAPASEK